ncbi:MAG TPA: glycosyltransferase [Acidimicrobiales bacterium]|jgi:UDP-N-acetylglucosamine:LPS N-acetylglucosamine transferase|nr:glycosyltransferase [Acidimicrobiales bacterium]
MVPTVISPGQKGGEKGAGTFGHCFRQRRLLVTYSALMKGPTAILSTVRSRVLVVSASMGAGHDGAARELVRRLRAEGEEAEMRDFLTSAPLRIGSLLKSSYSFQMRYVSWSYDLTYKLCYRLPALCPPIGMVMARLTGPRLLRWATEYRADVVVSTYPLTTVVLGQLRQRGALDVPAINFITDFGVHPLWTHPGIDLNLAVHTRPAAAAAAHSGRPAIATGPMVSPRFAAVQDRDAARAELDLGPDDRAVLIVSGSWGVGDVASTFRTIAASEGFVPVVVCGRDERLRERLSRIPGGRVLGWTDNMPALMAAADALVENAGGLTAMEALSVGLPIISFHPIAGHGKENTAEMQAAGVSQVARTPEQLLAYLDEVTAPGVVRQAMVDAGQAMFVTDPTRFVRLAARVGAAGLADRELLAGVASGGDEADLDELAGIASGVGFDPAAELRALLADAAHEAPLAPVIPIGAARDEREAAVLAATGTDDATPDRPAVGGEDVDVSPVGADRGRRRPRRPSVAVARLAALAAAIPLIWAGLTSGVAAATSFGAGVAHPPSHSGNVAYLGVRLDPSQLPDAGIAQQLVALHATAVVDEQTAASDPTDVQRLVGLGIDVENGGAGAHFDRLGHHVGQSPWRRADGDIAASHFLSRIAGQPVKLFVPGRRLNAFDLVACYGAHNKTVVPDATVQAVDADGLTHLTARHTYMVNGSNATPAQVRVVLDQLAAVLAQSNLSGAPLSALA